MADISDLNSGFAIPDQVTFVEGPGGLVMVNISNDLASAAIALQGAQLIDWTPAGEKPVIWVSEKALFAPAKAIRGGVPICWPWFGPHPSEASFPAHGIARSADWDIIATEALADGSTRLSFRLPQTEATRAYWPESSELILNIQVGSELTLELVTRNTGASSFLIGQALHTYFVVSAVDQVKVEGLEDLDYIDKVDAGTRKHQSGPVTLSAETDRIYLDTAGPCSIEDPGLKRRIVISKGGSRSTVVWNPWGEKAAAMADMSADGYKTMLCVETTNAAEDCINLAAGAEHSLWTSYRVEALS